MSKLTKQGRRLMSWLKHWEISSRIGDDGILTQQAKAEEKVVLAMLRRMVRSKYSQKGSER